MIYYQTELTIDFGEVGYSNSKHPFRVRLDASALAALIGHAENAHRGRKHREIANGRSFHLLWGTDEDHPC